MKRILLFLLLFISSLQAKPKYDVSICAIFRNEAPYLKEWIEYHQMIGVDHFYLFNHLSEDEYASVLQPYIDSGVVELFDWPHEITSYDNWIQEIQCATYNLILNERRDESRWLAVIDTDEFIFLKSKIQLPKFLKSYRSFAALGVNWQMFGTSNVAKSTSLLKDLIYRAPRNHPVNLHVKCIVRPKKIERFDNPHFPVVKAPYLAVTETKETLKGAQSSSVSVGRIRINHYVYRDESFYYGEKHTRYLRKYPDFSGSPTPPNPDYNLIKDTSADRYLPTLKKRLKAA